MVGHPSELGLLSAFPFDLSGFDRTICAEKAFDLHPRPYVHSAFDARGRSDDDRAALNYPGAHHLRRYALDKALELGCDSLSAAAVAIPAPWSLLSSGRA